MAGDGERRRAGIEGDALAVRDHRGGGRPDLVLGVAIEPLPDPECALRTVRLQADGAAVGSDETALGLEGEQVLSDRDGRDGEHRGEVTDAGPAMLLDESAIRRRRSRAKTSVATTSTGPFVGVRRVVSTHANRNETKVSIT